MHYVKAKTVRDRLEFLTQYFVAIGNNDAAAVLQVAIAEIMQEETFIFTPDAPRILADRPRPGRYNDERRFS